MPRWRKMDTYGYRFMGRPQTARRLSWRKSEIAYNLPGVPNGTIIDVTPAPGRTYTRETWPPRGRGRGESLTSPRRIAAKLRSAKVIKLRIEGYTWQQIARHLGFKDASGPYRAYKRVRDRMDWDEQRKAELRKQRGK